MRQDSPQSHSSAKRNMEGAGLGASRMASTTSRPKDGSESVYFFSLAASFLYSATRAIRPRPRATSAQFDATKALDGSAKNESDLSRPWSTSGAPSRDLLDAASDRRGTRALGRHEIMVSRIINGFGLTAHPKFSNMVPRHRLNPFASATKWASPMERGQRCRDASGCVLASVQTTHQNLWVDEQQVSKTVKLGLEKASRSA